MYKNKVNLNALNVINLILVLFILSTVNIFAQDIHFSQFRSTPLFINPANTGISTSNYRFSADYRSQWQQIDNPFRTIMLGFDARLAIFNRQAGIGLMVINDESAGNYMNADKFMLSFSHSFFFKNNQLVIGLQPGYVLKKLNNRLTFGDQFDPNSHTFDPGIPGNEGDLNERLDYFDLNTGILWQTRIKNLLPSAGFSISHINHPVESFYSSEPGTKIPLKYIVHGKILIPLNEHFYTEPQLLYSYTKSSKEFIGGGLLYYYPGIQDISVSKIYSLSAVRINPVRNFDALIFGAGAEVGSFDVCVSYDINISTLRKASRYQGAFEVSLIYNTGRKKFFNMSQPCFML
jgi:type IX secretion system PorP/SprF family membrane protein